MIMLTIITLTVDIIIITNVIIDIQNYNAKHLPDKNNNIHNNYQRC